MSWDIGLVKQELRGPAALVMTPFNDDLSLNLSALRDNIRYIMDGGLRTGRGHIICPSGTGEYLTLSLEEHRLMVQTAVEVTEGRLPVVAGAAGIDIREVIQKVENATQAGAKYTMIAPPFYDSIDQDAIYEWYRILGESTDAGIMIYDQSWRADLGTTLEVPLIERLAGLDSVVSLKYGSPNLMPDMIVALERFADRFAFIDNSLAYTAVLAHMHGGTGFISGPATWWPEFELTFFDLMEEGKYTEAEQWHARIAPYMALFHGEFNKGARVLHQAALVKASMEYVGLYAGPLRPPFRAVSTEERKEVYAILDALEVKRPVHV